MKKLALLCLLLALACKRDAEAHAPDAAATKAPPPIQVDRDADNLLNLAYGAAVVSRTGELNLDNSAVQAIDGIFASFWTSSPGVTNETLIYSVLAPSRITHVGITPVKGDEVPRRVRFDGSLDGKSWSELATIETQNVPRTEKVEERQLVAAKESVVRYVRVQPVEQQTYYVHARGFHLLGAEVQPPAPPPFTGCWIINGQRAHIVQEKARLTGVIEANPPIYLDGGTDNRVGLVMWMQGPTWGYAALSRTPDGAHITGLRFYEEAFEYQLGEGWMGDRCDAPPALQPLDPREFLRRAKRYSVFGVAFDDQARLSAELSARALDDIRALAPRRIEVREYAFDDHARNRIRAQAKIAALRAALQARGMNVANVEFVAAGSESDGPSTASSVQRLLGTRIDIIPPR